MTDISFFTHKFRTQKPISSVVDSPRTVKRARLVCNACQKSKLRCDRGQPCSSCIKRGDGDGCSYQPVAGSKSQAEDKLAHLESMVKRLMETQQAEKTNHGNVATVEVESAGEVRAGEHGENGNRNGNANGDGGYVGSTHWSAILDDINELKIELGSSPSSASVEAEPPPISPSSNTELIFGSLKNYNLQQILAQYLPPKLEVDRFLAAYFQGQSFITFIHSSQFESQYRTFWADTANVNPLWLSMLFSVCHLGTLVGKNIGLRDRDEGTTRFLIAAGQCLVLGGYHRPQKFAVEALGLYGHCINLRSLDPSREAGMVLAIVVRMAYEMGYHRDPDSFGSFTVFEGEMRRLTWAGIKQMDLMISFQLGLPSNICLENCDTRPPRNLIDSDFNTETQVLPPSRPETEATKMTWFIVKDRMLGSFAKVCQDALSFKERTDAEILQMHQEILDMYATVPGILRPRPLSESIADPPYLIMTRLYIDFIYLKSLCVLHRKYMAQGSAFSTKTCVEAGTKLVGQFADMYKELATGGQLHMYRWMLNNFNMTDFHLGVMVLCLVVHTRRKQGSHGTVIDDSTEIEVLGLLEQSLAICVEKSVVSRDARRVSQAIRLTLGGIKASTRPKNGASSSSSSIPGSSNWQSTINGHGDDSTSPWLSNWQSYTQSDGTAFGMLDPFNLMGNELENMDWTTFDPQI